MAFIGNFPSAGSAVFNLDYLPEKVLVNGSNSENQALSSFSVVCGGVQLMSITSVARLTALAKFDSGAILLDPLTTPTAFTTMVAQYIRLATGRINKGTTITGTNTVAADRAFYAASTCISDVARRAVETSINQSANATFSDFEALFFLPSDIIRAQITFANGFTDEYTVTELVAMYANYHICDSSGLLEGLLCIDADSPAGLISQVVLFNGTGGSTVVLKSDYVQL
jgi:hypothetical protein